MDKIEKKAKKLFDKGKMIHSLEFYDKVITARFSKYPKALVEYEYKKGESGHQVRGIFELVCKVILPFPLLSFIHIGSQA